ncbi:hypothetical protein ACIQBJ_12825 [Kitasatospora sp. NPDC088391]|uniref:hypothetical protein n=1 Tax=Kitasatospora sp. NPDC088391 TaxID=3364074 RepID=UPI003813C4B9
MKLRHIELEGTPEELDSSELGRALLAAIGGGTRTHSAPVPTGKWRLGDPVHGVKRQNRDADEPLDYIAAAVIAPGAEADARAALRALHDKDGRTNRKLHWTEMDHRQRTDAAETVAALGGLHVVAFGTPVPARRQERARAKCLGELVRELHGFGVDRLHLEARQSALNGRDVKTVAAARRFEQLGRSAYWWRLKDCVVELDVVTEC